MTRFYKRLFLLTAFLRHKIVPDNFVRLAGSWQKVIIPFQGASNNVSLCGKYSSGIIFYIRAAETRWSNWSQVT